MPVEVRGAGPATRQVTGFGVPGFFDGAEKLVACELLTPPGNWSSYPPHKHDATDPCPVVNEEIEGSITATASRSLNWEEPLDLLNFRKYVTPLA